MEMVGVIAMRAMVFLLRPICRHLRGKDQRLSHVALQDGHLLSPRDVLLRELARLDPVSISRLAAALLLAVRHNILWCRVGLGIRIQEVPRLRGAGDAARCRP
jgi:hypothetical protein